MRRSFAILVLSATIIAASDARPRTRELSLRNLPLKAHERVAAIQIDIAGASFKKVSIPCDWGLDVSPPVAVACTLKAFGQHSSAFLSPNQFNKFATLEMDGSRDSEPFAVRASIIAILYDSSDKEHQRVIKLPKECIVVD